MRIALAQRMTDAWLAAVELARKAYRDAYDADVLPAPDLFITAHAPDPAAHDGQGRLVGCAGLTFGRPDRPLFSERYLDGPVEKVLQTRLGVTVDRRRVVEVGALASGERHAGREVIRLTPIISWCLGMEYILCTATQSLMAGLARAGITFEPLSPADPSRLEPGQLAQWGTYYEQEPQVGVIPLNALHRLFTEATGRYRFFDGLRIGLADAEVLSHAGR